MGTSDDTDQTRQGYLGHFSRTDREEQLCLGRSSMGTQRGRESKRPARRGMGGGGSEGSEERGGVGVHTWHCEKWRRRREWRVERVGKRVGEGGA